MDRYRIDLRSVDWKIDIMGCVNGSLNCRTRPMINRITSCKQEERDHEHRSVWLRKGKKEHFPPFSKIWGARGKRQGFTRANPRVLGGIVFALA
jgi:hypothetical protein